MGGCVGAYNITDDTDVFSKLYDEVGLVFI